MWPLEGHLRTPNPAPGAVGHFEPDDAAKPRHRQACPDRRAERGHVPPDDSRRRNPHYDAAIIALGEGCDDPHVPKHSARKRVLKRSRYEDHEWPGRALAGRLRIPAGSGSRGHAPRRPPIAPSGGRSSLQSDSWPHSGTRERRRPQATGRVSVAPAAACTWLGLQDRAATSGRRRWRRQDRWGRRYPCRARPTGRRPQLDWPDDRADGRSRFRLM